MAKSKELKCRFRVSLFSRDGSGPRETICRGNHMQVNHRGDLLIVETGSAYGEDRLIAAFKSGIWSEASRIEDVAE